MSHQPSARERARQGGAYVLGVAADLAIQGRRRLIAADGGDSLHGDRWVEWSFCFARMANGPGSTLDFGADIGFLALAAAQRGHDVVAFDLLPSALDYTHPRVTHVQGDVLTHDFRDRRFDQILNCSSVEHVGLGGRYASTNEPDGDLKAMAILQSRLAPTGRMIMTIPVGCDMVCAPQHRIYGQDRLPRLLDGYHADEQQFWEKSGGVWRRSERDVALGTKGSSSFYSLGLFVLTRG